MSIPKSKLITASRAIMAIAAKAKYNTDESVKAIQNQTVNVNVQQQPPPQPAAIINHVSRPSSAPAPSAPAAYKADPTNGGASRPSSAPAPSAPEIIERDIQLDLEEPETPTPATYGITTPAPAPAPVTAHTNVAPVTVSTVPETETDYYEELETLHAMVSNYETVSKALILIIELYMSNPLVINKIIVPTEDVFRELVKVLTGADDIEVRYTEEVGCTLGSKKYKLVEDIIVIKNTEPKSLKYSHPDVIRLFDRFNISVKMLSK